ncbi:MAG: hypothetical protein QG635_2159, partial [Bacteroidota bacterium]|nr:hypothetical protein [Bacteroidota bacterium]
MLNEIVESYDDHFSKELNEAKKHKGQIRIAAAIRYFLNSSSLIRKRSEHLFKKINEKVVIGKVQEYYSVRCVPQILGPILDTIDNASEVLLNEINSVSDNPIIDMETENVYHGGNFHGDYVSFEMDKLKIAVTKLSMLSERQLNFLMNDKLNGKLPPFINLGILGLNFGMQGLQYTATSTTAENQTLSYPMYLHSIPNNNDNQDIVSMGSNSALLAKKVIDNSYTVLAIEIIAILQAIDYLGCCNELSKYTMNIFNDLRNIAPKFIEDKPMSDTIEEIKRYIINKDAVDLDTITEN